MHFRRPQKVCLGELKSIDAKDLVRIRIVILNHYLLTSVREREREREIFVENKMSRYDQLFSSKSEIKRPPTFFIDLFN